MVNTTHGSLEESALAKTVGFEDRPDEFVVSVEWRLTSHDVANCSFCQNAENPRPDANGVVLVRRDAHVILKQPSVVADALVGGIG